MARDRTERIEILLQDAKNLYVLVKKCSYMIDQLEGTELHDMYSDETSPLIDQHALVLKELAIEFEEHFIWEKESKAAVNLEYRRLYNEMKKDFNPQVPPASFPD